MPKTGRPERDDDETLLAIAEVVFRNPQIAIADAIRRVVTDFSHEQSKESAIRRLRDKFKYRRPLLIAMVQQDTQTRKVYLMSPDRVSFRPAELIEVSEALQASIIPPEIQRMQEQLERRFNTPVMQQILQMRERLERHFNTPAMRRMQERLERHFNAPEMRRMQERAALVEKQLNTPAMQRARKVANKLKMHVNSPEIRDLITNSQKVRLQISF